MIIKRFFSLPRYILWLLYICLAALIIATLAVASGIYWLSSDSGQNYVHNLINEKVSNELGYKIDIEDISFHFPLNARISNIALSDKKGKWIEVNNLAITILPTLNIYNHCIIHNISADQIRLLRKPEMQITHAANDNRNSNISVLRIDMKEVIIAASVIDFTHDVVFSLNGSIKWKGLEKHLSFEHMMDIKNIHPNLASLQISSSGSYLIEQATFNANFKSIFNNKIEAVGYTNFNLNSKDIYLDVRTKNFIFSELIDGSAGEANVELKIEGTIDKPIINAIAKSYNVVYQKKNIPNVIAFINGTLDNNKWQGNLKIETKDEIKANLDYLWSGKIIKFSNIYLDYLKSSIIGNLSLDTDKMLLDGKLDTNILSIEKFKDYLPEPMVGRINISTNFSSKVGVQEVNNKIQLQNFIIRGATISEADIEVRTPNLLIFEPAIIQASLYKIEHKNFIINTAKITTQYQNRNWSIALAAKGNDKIQDFELITNGNLCIDKTAINEKQITLNKFEGSYGENKFSNTGKIIFFSNAEYQSVLIPKIKLAKGEFSLTARLKEDKVDLTSAVKHISLKLFKQYLPKQFINQDLNFNLHILGELQNPQVNLDLSMHNSKEEEKAQEFNSDITIKIKDKRAIFNAKSNTKALLYYNLYGNIPINFSLKDPILLSIEEHAPIQATLDYNLDVSTLANILLSSAHIIQGKVFGKLVISGTYFAPLINGQIKCNEGTYKYFPLGIKLKNINTDISLQNNLLTINKLVIEDYKQNELLISGNANFSDIKNYLYSIKVNTKKFYLINHLNIYSIVSGNIFINGNNKSGNIKGFINSEKLDIYLPDEFTSSIPKLNVTKVISDSSESKPLKSEFFSYPIVLNVNLQAKNKVFIHGWGVDAELGGKLVLNGNMQNPEVQGKLSTIRGRYEEFGKKFKLKQAELLFEGNIPPSPYLNIIGSLTKSGIEIMPVLYGPITSPSLTIESSPAKPQEEALSILLFGKDSTKINTFQAIQLANSLKKISTRNNSGVDPLYKIRNLFGLDDITINNDSDNAGFSSVGVEKYVTDNVRVNLNQGKTTQESNAKIEIDLTPNVSVESRSDAAGNNGGIGLNWKHDY